MVVCAPDEVGGHQVVAVILLDMVGSKNLKFSNERYSHKGLMQLRDEVLTALPGRI